MDLVGLQLRERTTPGTMSCSVLGLDCGHKPLPKSSLLGLLLFFCSGMSTPQTELHGSRWQKYVGACENYGLFLDPIIIRHLIFSVPKKGPQF